MELIDTDWEIHPVFPQLIPASFVFLFRWRVHSRRQRDCCSSSAFMSCLQSPCALSLTTQKNNVRAKSTPKNAPSSEPPTPRCRSASRKGSHGGRSPSGKPTDSRAVTKPCDCWHPPECPFFFSQNRLVNSAKSAHSRTGRLMNNLAKGPKRVMTKVQLLL